MKRRRQAPPPVQRGERLVWGSIGFGLGVCLLRVAYVAYVAVVGS